jgi:hypothetical protein
MLSRVRTEMCHEFVNAFASSYSSAHLSTRRILTWWASREEEGIFIHLAQQPRSLMIWLVFYNVMT